MTSLDERLIEAATASLELFGVYLGSRLDLYGVLAERGPLPADGLAVAAGIHPRYALEWLEQQAVAGFLTVDDVGLAADVRRFALPDEHVGILVDVDNPSHVAPLAAMTVGIGGVLDEVVRAYRTGGGVPYRMYGAAFRGGQGGINRPAFSHDLTGSWLPALPDVHDRLSRPGARIADVGCGQGFSTIALAKAYPQAEVLGLDADAASIDDARQFARDAGETVRFISIDAAELAHHGPFDAVLILESLHDLARPIDALLAARKALSTAGSVIVVDERVQPHFTAPGDQLERMMYGWSITHCLPSQRAEEPSASIGTVIREDHVRSLAAEAGFGHTEVTDIDAGFFRIYRLTTETGQETV
jgi:2-polyprenyl-3-methyl-5-hydroxy-6-metoxy-1,4-benzoquinol methylase